MKTIVAWLAALAAGATFAAQVQIPGGTLIVPGTASGGASFGYSGTLTDADTIAFAQAGNPCLQTGGTAYCVNGAGVLTVAGSFGELVGQATTFSGPSGIIPAGTWNYGALLMQISGVGTVQVFPANAANGLGSSAPPKGLVLPATTLGSLGFGTFSQANPTITFVLADTNFADNGAQFALNQATPPVPTLSEWGMIALGALLAASGMAWLRRRRLA